MWPGESACRLANRVLPSIAQTPHLPPPGYKIINVARCWAAETGLAVGADLSDHLPPNEYYEYYAPGGWLHALVSVLPVLVLGECRPTSTTRPSGCELPLGGERRVVVLGACRRRALPADWPPAPPPSRPAVGYSLRVQPRGDLDNDNSREYLDGLR